MNLGVEVVVLVAPCKIGRVVDYDRVAVMVSAASVFNLCCVLSLLFMLNDLHRKRQKFCLGVGTIYD